MTEDKPTTNYLALTIGPVYRTIANARKTRELWAASFLLSQFMRCLLEKLAEKNFGEPLSPDISNLKETKKWHGAGIWNDNCFFKIYQEHLDILKKELPEIIAAAKEEIINLALFDLEKKGAGLPESDLRKIIAQHFHCHAVLINRPASAEEPVLQQLSALSASVEMRDLYPTRHDDFVSATMFRGSAVKGLYHLGFEERDKIFTFYQNRFDSNETLRRMPSLLEIGLREFRSDEDLYSKIAKIISDNAHKGDDETDDENQAIIDLLKPLKDERAQSIFKKRHKYVAIVQSDGDGVGRLISTQNNEDEIKTISKKLMQFSTDAVEKIVAFDGLPVYAGGDDLLFIAPLQNKEQQYLFDLLETIQAAFKAQGLPPQTSMSFGVSIFYYKYPLGEALENGRELLQNLAKKLAFRSKNDATKLEKNALAFRVMLHAGQSFAAVLRQEGKTWKRWKKLIKAKAGNDTAFISGVVHTLEQLGYLLEQACKDATTKAFFEHHFNEAKGTERWKFVKRVRKLAKAIHQEYASLLLEPSDKPGFFAAQIHEKDLMSNPETAFRNNLLYAALRMIQFLNADDHE